MSLDILTEARLLVLSVGLGAVLSAIYGVLCLFRGLLPHHWLAVGVEDMVYWLFAGFAVFYLLYRENDGSLRLCVIGVVLLLRCACCRAGRTISRKVLKKTGECFKIKKKQSHKTT